MVLQTIALPLGDRATVPEHLPIRSVQVKKKLSNIRPAKGDLEGEGRGRNPFAVQFPTLYCDCKTVPLASIGGSKDPPVQRLG
jgi:hypothetical protein